jgi:O-antigen/teichoic acid export membrane protein
MIFKYSSLNVRSFKLITPIKLEIYSYSKNFSLWGVFGWAQNFLDKYTLQYFCDNSKVAIYSVYYQYGFFPFTILSSILSQYLTPIFFSKLELGGMIYKKYFKRILLYSTLLLLFSIISLPILAIYIAPYFIKYLTNEHYLQEISIFPIIVSAGVFYCCAQVITVPLLSVFNVSKVKYPKILASVFAIALFYFLVPNYKLFGLLISLLISNLLYFFFLFCENLKVYRILE